MNIFRKVVGHQLISYLAIGGLTALLYFGLFALSVEVMGFGYRVGVSVAYVFAVSFHFFANRRFTFRSDGGLLLRQSVRYVVVLCINYFITLGVISLLVEAAGCSAYVGAALSIILTVGIGYFASKFWVFGKGESSRD